MKRRKRKDKKITCIKILKRFFKRMIAKDSKYLMFYKEYLKIVQSCYAVQK